MILNRNNLQNSIDIVEIKRKSAPVMQTATTSKQAPGGLTTACLELVAEQISKLRFGVVQITVHDGQVVQIERTERVRFATTHLTRTEQA